MTENSSLLPSTLRSRYFFFLESVNVQPRGINQGIYNHCQPCEFSL